MKRIYLDYGATTPIDKRVSKAMRDFELRYFGNPSSVHREGQKARALIDTARQNIAQFIGAKTQEIIFTSGATEANNLAIQGTVSHYVKKYKTKPHVITTLLEHQSVHNTVKELQGQGIIEATFIKPSPDGLITSGDIAKEIKNNTALVSVIFASNEIGSLLPVREIGRLLPPGILFHVDAVQAAKFYNCNVNKLECDLLTLSGHKLYGPKGIGALYVKSGVKLQNLLYGGSQEYGKRPGTQNTAGIIGLAKAIELMGSLEDRQNISRQISKLRDKLILALKKNKQAELNGQVGEARSADNVSFTVYNTDQDALITALDLANIAASTGSACVSGSTAPSHVIEALGKIKNKKAATVRFTLGKNTTDNEIKFTTQKFKQILSKLRS